MENKNAQLTKELHDAFSANEFDKCLQMAADNVVVKAHALGMTFNGPQEFAGFMQGFKQAFPDMKIIHKNLVSEGNKVAVEFTATGTHTGPLQTPMGTIPASGNSIKLDVMESFEWQDGKFTSLNNYQDAGSLMRQIGAM